MATGYIHQMVNDANPSSGGTSSGMCGAVIVTVKLTSSTKNKLISARLVFSNAGVSTGSNKNYPDQPFCFMNNTLDPKVGDESLDISVPSWLLTSSKMMNKVFVYTEKLNVYGVQSVGLKYIDPDTLLIEI